METRYNQLLKLIAPFFKNDTLEEDGRWRCVCGRVYEPNENKAAHKRTCIAHNTPQA